MVTNCLLLLNDGSSKLLLNDGISKLLLNSLCDLAGSGGGLARRHRKQKVVPQFDPILEETPFSIFIRLKPFKILTMFQDVKLVPMIKQYQIILFDIMFRPVTSSYESLSRFVMKPSLIKETIVNIAMRQNSKGIEKYSTDIVMTLKAVRNHKYSQAIKLKALNGINLIRRATKIIEDNKMSFTFEEDKIEWQGLTNISPVNQDKQEEEREQEFNQSSSFVGRVIYSPDLSTMEINLSGITYNFCRVPQRIFESFKGAGSKGAFFNRAIKGQFNC